ncbi:hypothetical protein FOE78_06750 [Microlunatus elymi]|uniref:Uncharacterized protein n=1 Tax=Microlunatus elymi TaxID=2596828 RepID=A0A516PWT2_9ACTN|nr:hypothetical protein [Microlunatus elymi]QDP95645.1 hypothetical protein FOE78_06750 [Microlunatus elymi]
MIIPQQETSLSSVAPPNPEKHSGDPRVQRAFTIGWQVAQLFAYPVPLEPLEPHPLDGELPGLDQLSAARRYRLLARTIAAAYETLSVPQDPVGPAPSVDATIAALNRAGHTADEVREAVLALHVQLLEALNAADFRLGKAYGMGRLLSETTTLVGAGGPDRPDPAGQQRALEALFASDRLLVLKRWLSALKSDLPDHTAYAVSRSLEAWQGQHRADPDTARAALRSQGHIWRTLLSGEKAAVDLLSAGDYVAASRAMLHRMARLGAVLVRTFWWGILIVVAALAATIVGVSVSGNLTGVTKAITNLLASLVALGVTVKGLSMAAAKVAAKLEVPLWQSELDEAVAVASTRIPSGATLARRSGGTVGKLEVLPTPAGEPQRGTGQEEPSPA